jgi:hypothetical protein
MKTRITLLIMLLMASAALAQEDSYRSGFVPPVPEPFPPAYAQYQALPGTFSPDKSKALIYPKRSVLDDPNQIKEAGLYLVALKPFRVITELECGNIAYNHGDYGSQWADDGSTLVFEELSKWGPDRVSLVWFQPNGTPKIVDLAAEVRKKLKPSFEKAHAERYNDYYDFIFDADHTDRWAPSRETVEITCYCTNNPKPGKKWLVRFDGVWSVPKGRFTRFKVTRINSSDSEYNQ